jgi:excisionase family DNA binding protein
VAGKTRKTKAPLQSLQKYPEPYVTIGQLAQYWLVSRKQLYKHVESGALKAIRLGPRLLRIRTADASEFEKSLASLPVEPQSIKRRSRL